MIAPRDVFGDGHLVGKVGLAGRDAVTVIFGVGEDDGIALFGVEAGEGFFGEDDAEGVADFAELEFERHDARCNYESYNVKAGRG